MDSTQDIIMHNSRRFLERYADGDAQALAMLYTEDAQFLAPGMSQQTSREAIRRFWQAAIDSKVRNFQHLDFKMTKTSDRLCVQYFTFEMTHTAADGSTRTDSIKNVLTWERVGDDWLINLDIWNSPI